MGAAGGTAEQPVGVPSAHAESKLANWMEPIPVDLPTEVHRPTSRTSQHGEPAQPTKSTITRKEAGSRPTEKEDRPRPTYITLMRLTEQGIKDLKTAPVRLQAEFKVWELLGGKMLGTYFAMGDYDNVVITEAPNDEAATTANLAISAREHVKTATMRAFTIQEFSELAGKLP